MKKLLKVTCAVLALSLLVTGCGKEIEVKNGSKVAVSVKGEKFTATEYYNEIKEDNIAVLIDMIDAGLLEKKYPKGEEEDKYVDDQIKQIKSYYGDSDETFKQVLTSFGVESEKELKEKLRLEYKRTQAVEDYIKDHLTDKEIKDYYNKNISGEVEAKHILIAVDVANDAPDEEKEEADKKALEKAQKLIKKIKNGEDFAKLAKKNSDDEGTASKGGDLGYFQPDEMVTEFAEAVKALKVDEYTKEPVKTQFGYHIILKTGEKDKKKLKEVKDDIKETLKEQKLDADKTVYYTTLMAYREENKIKWNDTALKSAYEKYMDKIIESVKESK